MTVPHWTLRQVAWQGVALLAVTIADYCMRLWRYAERKVGRP